VGLKAGLAASAARKAPACRAAGMLSGYSGKISTKVERRDLREPGRMICSLFSKVTMMLYPHLSPG